MPPGRTRSAAARSSSSWSSGSGSRAPAQVGPRARARRAPSRARRRARGRSRASSGGSARRRRGRRVTFAAPSRATFSSQLARARLVSPRPRSPRRASIVALPPGAAQRSRTRSPALRADDEAGELRAAALRPDPPLGERLLVDALDARTRPGRRSARRPESARGRAARPSRGGSFCARISASASSAPRSRPRPPRPSPGRSA